MSSIIQNLTETKHSTTPDIKNYDALLLKDVLCPICRSIMTDPVSLPCNHDFCLCCFDDTMKNANLECPLCQVRVGSWWRKALSEEKHINRKLQAKIFARFFKQVSNKLKGIEDNSVVPEVVVPDSKEEEQENEIVENTEFEVEDKVGGQLSSHNEMLVESIVDKEKPEVESSLESCEDATFSNDESCDEPSDLYAAKQFVCRIFPLDVKDKTKRETIFSPCNVTASKIKTERKLKELKEKDEYYEAVQVEKMRLQEQFEARLKSGGLFTWPPSKADLSPLEKLFRNVVTPLKVPEPSDNDICTKENKNRESILKEKNNNIRRFNSELKNSQEKKRIDSFHKKKQTSASRNNSSGSTKSPSDSASKKTPPVTSNKNILSLKEFDFDEDSNSSDCDFGPLLGFNELNIPHHAPSVKLKRKMLQETRDLEFAKEIQERFNRTHFTRKPSKLSRYVWI